MSDVNSVFIEGRLGRDPQIITTETGKIGRFSIASAQHYKSGDEVKENVTWTQVALYDKYKIETAEKSLHKGSHVLISGQLESHSYDDNGTTRYSTEVALRPGKSLLKILDVTPKDKPAADPSPDLRTAAGQRQQEQQYRHEQ